MKDCTEVVDFLRNLTERVSAGTEKTAEETTETTTPVEGQGKVGGKLDALAADAAGKRNVSKATTGGGDMSANKDGSPKKGDGDAPADIETSGPMEASPEAKEAARKGIDFDKLAEACVIGVDLMKEDATQKEAQREVEAELEGWRGKGVAYRAVLLEEFDKMAEQLDAQSPGFRKQFEALGGSVTLLEKLAETMPSAIVPEELGDEAAEYEQGMSEDNDAQMLEELGITPEQVAEAEQVIEQMIAEGVPKRLSSKP